MLNVIDDITRKNKIQISYNDREKILRIFTLIDQASSKSTVTGNIWLVLNTF